MASPWQWDERSRRYRDSRSGRYLGEPAIRRLRDEFTARVVGRSDALAAAVTEGGMSAAQWHQQSRALLKSTYVDQYLLGRGGLAQMTPADWGRVGRQLKDQYAYLDGFARELTAGEMTEAAVAARSALYYGSARQAYESARAASRGLTLPAYPGDGSSACLGRCSCSWLITETKTAFEATWSRGKSDSCPDCVSRAARWAPYTVSKT